MKSQSLPNLLIHALALALWANASLHAQNWTQQGGPNHDHVAPEQALNMDWNAENAPIKWRANVGFGSSPVVVQDGRVYTFGAYLPETGVEQLDDPARVPEVSDLKKYDVTLGQAAHFYPEIGIEGFAPKSKLNDPAMRDAVIAERRFLQTWSYVQCFDAETGKRLWATLLNDHLLLSDNHQQWPRSSPLIAGNTLYIHDSNGQLHALNAQSGEVVWQVNLAEHGMATFHDKEPNACSPLYHDGKVILQYNNRGMVVGAFDADNGEEVWRYTSTFSSFRSHFSRLGFAEIHGQPTVLVPDGWATTGLDPTNGEVRWQLDVYSESTAWKRAAYEEVKAARMAEGLPDPGESQLTRGYACYTSYAPVAWGDYVIDYRDYAHSDYISSTYCLKIGDSKPEIVWQTNAFVPEAYPAKSNMIARDGRLYFFEFSYHSYIPRVVQSRLGRPEGVEQFICMDIPSGELLWSSDAFRKSPSAEDDFKDQPNGYKFILAGNQIIANGDDGLWLGTITENGAEAEVAILSGSGGKFGIPNLPAEPVLVDQTLFYRQTMPQAGKGILGVLGGTGNLLCFDLKP